MYGKAAIYLILCICFGGVIDLTRSSYTLQVSVYGYSNPSKQELSGVCCDDLCSACYTTFQFCFQREDSRHAEDMMAECSLGFLSTDGSPILDAEDKLVFTLGKEFTKGLQNPLEFTGSQLFKDMKLSVMIHNKESGRLIDLIEINNFVTPAIYHTGNYKKARMWLGFKVTCNHGYYGEDCLTFCDPSPDEHYTCDGNGMKVCHNGFVNPSTNCLQRVEANTRRDRSLSDDSTGMTTVTNSGSKFYIGFMQNFVRPLFKSLPLRSSSIFVLTNDSSDVTVNILSPGGVSSMYSLQPGVTSIKLLFDVRVEDETDRDKGIRIWAQQDKLVSVHTLDEEIYSVEGYTALPCTALLNDTDFYEYYAVSVPETSTLSDVTTSSAFLIVACDDNTTVTLSPTQTIVDPQDSSLSISSDENKELDLNEGETVYIRSVKDLTGSHIVSDKPLTVLSGHECGNVPYDQRDCNKLVEQIPPTAVWGNMFFTAPTATRRTGDVFKVVASQDNTGIEVSCNSAAFEAGARWNNSVVVLKAGDSYNFTAPVDHYCSIATSKPALVVQFTPGAQVDASRSADPFMSLVPASHHFLNSYTLTTVNGVSLRFDNYLSIFVSHQHFEIENIQLDGQPILNWTNISCMNGSVCGHAAQMSIKDGVHHLNHGNPAGLIGVIVYGLSARETYAFIGGMALSFAETSHGEANSMVQRQQKDLAIPAGASICLDCALEAVDNQEWTFNESSHAHVMDNGTLCITDAAVGDGGTYTCSDGLSSLVYRVSVMAGIIIQPAPISETQHEVNIAIGLSPTTYIDSNTTLVRIYCPVEGMTQTPQWLVDMEPPVADEKFNITPAFLGIRGPFEEGCTTYTCRVKINAFVVEERSEICSGDFAPPTLVVISGPEKVVEGESFSLHCLSNGFPEPTKNWNLRGYELPYYAIDVGNGTLELYNISDGLETTYCCTAFSSFHKYLHAEACKDIVIIVPPKFRLFESGDDLYSPSVPAYLSLPLNPNIEVRTQIGQNVHIVRTYSLVIECPVIKGSPTPDISWQHNNENVSQELLSSKNSFLTINSVTVGVHNGTYTCTASLPDAEFHRFSVTATSTVTIMEPPVIEEPPSPKPAAGDCVDLTSKQTSTVQIGSDVCARASSLLYIDCKVTGVPLPTLTWLKNGVPIEYLRQLEDKITSFANGTILLNELVTDFHARINNDTMTSGNYTCVAINKAGIAISSTFVVAFGDIPLKAVPEYIKPIEIDLYQEIETALLEHIADMDENGVPVLLDSGRILHFGDFDHGRLFDGSEDTVPPVVMERMFDLMDVIPDVSHLISQPDNSASLAETYKDLINNMEVKSKAVSEDELTAATMYLQELVADLENHPETSGILKPRLSIYLRYKLEYHVRRTNMEQEINNNKATLSGEEFSSWYTTQGKQLEYETNSIYLKWEALGYKSDVEAQLAVLDLEDHSVLLNEARAILLAASKTSLVHEDKQYFPVGLFPSRWYELYLAERSFESILQLQFQLAIVESKKEVLKTTSRYLKQENTFEPNSNLNPHEINLLALQYVLDQEVWNSENQRYRCRVTRNPLDCQLYDSEHKLILELMNKFAEFYWEVAYIKSATSHQDFHITAIENAMEELEKEKQYLELAIQSELFKSTKQQYSGFLNAPIAEKSFVPLQYSSSKFNSKGNITLPSSIESRLLWHLNFESSTLDRGEIQLYNDTINYLNSLPVNVSANIILIDAHRRWFSPTLFDNKNLHLVRKHSETLVSPGPMPVAELRQTLSNGNYKMPVYPSSLVLATDVQLSVKVPFLLHVLPALLRLSFDQHVTGGFGPFVFGKYFEASKGRIKFRLEHDGDSTIKIVLPGTQLIGYICNSVPKLPKNEHSIGKRSEFRKGSGQNGNNFEQWISSKHFNNYNSQLTTNETSAFVNSLQQSMSNYTVKN